MSYNFMAPCSLFLFLFFFSLFSTGSTLLSPMKIARPPMTNNVFKRLVPESTKKINARKREERETERIMPAPIDASSNNQVIQTIHSQTSTEIELMRRFKIRLQQKEEEEEEQQSSSSKSTVVGSSRFNEHHHGGNSSTAAAAVAGAAVREKEYSLLPSYLNGSTHLDSISVHDLLTTMESHVKDIVERKKTRGTLFFFCFLFILFLSCQHSSFLTNPIENYIIIVYFSQNSATLLFNHFNRRHTKTKQKKQAISLELFKILRKRTKTTLK